MERSSLADSDHEGDEAQEIAPQVPQVQPPRGSISERELFNKLSTTNFTEKRMVEIGQSNIDSSVLCEPQSGTIYI